MIGIFTFSGTGNTQIVADNISYELEEKGKDLVQYRIEDCFNINDYITIGKMDVIIIGYPVYAYNAPKIVADFVKRLPQSNCQKVYLFKTSGEPFHFNNYSSYHIIRLLSKKGYKVMLESHVLMPYNIIFRYNDTLAKQMYITMLKRSKIFVEDIISKKYRPIKISLFGRFMSFLFRIQWSGARFNGLLYTIRKKKCIFCMKCIEECPTKNIIIKDNSIRFNSDCIMCMRCVQNCPADAIRIGLIQPWAINGPYDYNRILADDRVEVAFVKKHTKGYFRLFKKYFDID